MDYPFSHYIRHLQQWPKFANLEDVVIAPEKTTVPRHIGADSSPRALQMRFCHMLALEGCTKEERDYRTLRYFAMQAFVQMHEPAFRKAGFVLIDDGVGGFVPFSILRAVHETFRGDPFRDFRIEPSEPIIERARKYHSLKGWHYE